MVASFPRFPWPRRLGVVVASTAVALALTQAVRSGAERKEDPPVLVLQESIGSADARLQSEGWIAKPDREPLQDERRLAGNNLASLSACSGAGLGLCRYDYQRGSQQFAVVTVPSAKGEGIVHNWFVLESEDRPVRP